MVPLAIIGIVFVVGSFALWSARPPGHLGAVRGPGFNLLAWQGVLFVLWTIGPPLWALWSWHSYPPQPSELTAYGYEHRLIADVWAAFAAVLGVLFGVKK